MPHSIDIDAYERDGFLVISHVLNAGEAKAALALVDSLIDRHRRNAPAVVAASVSVAYSVNKHPERNSPVMASGLEREPYIIGDLLLLEPAFASIFSIRLIWETAATLLNVGIDEVMFHFSNVTCKPALFGPGVGWHRDSENTYFSAADKRTVRLLFPLHAMGISNGGTEVTPRSHHSKIHKNTPLDNQCPTVLPGACLALHSEVLHGGSPNRSLQDRSVVVLQFGVRHSTLTHRANEFLSCTTREGFLAFVRSL